MEKGGCVAHEANLPPSPHSLIQRGGGKNLKGSLHVLNASIYISKATKSVSTYICSHADNLLPRYKTFLISHRLYSASQDILGCWKCEQVLGNLRKQKQR